MTEAELLEEWGAAWTGATAHVIREDRPLCGSKVQRRARLWCHVPMFSGVKRCGSCRARLAKPRNEESQ